MIKTLLKALGVLVLGAVALVAFLWVLGTLVWLIKVALALAVLGAIGFAVLKVMSLGSSAPPRPDASDAKTEESRTLAPAGKKALSDADALKAFEEARRKQTEGNR